MALTSASGKPPRVAEPTEAPDEAPEASAAVDDDEIAALRAELAAAQQQIVALESNPSPRSVRNKDIPEGMERVVPQGDFELFYGGRQYKFIGGQPTIIPQEVANHLRAVRLKDGHTGQEIVFEGNSLFRTTNA